MLIILTKVISPIVLIIGKEIEPLTPNTDPGAVVFTPTKPDCLTTFNPG